MIWVVVKDSRRREINGENKKREKRGEAHQGMGFTEPRWPRLLQMRTALKDDKYKELQRQIPRIGLTTSENTPISPPWREERKREEKRR